jgi:hypothetical protein
MIPPARRKPQDIAFGRDEADSACGFNLSNFVKGLSSKFRRKARSGSLRDREEQLIILAPVERQLE